MSVLAARQGVDPTLDARAKSILLSLEPNDMSELEDREPTSVNIVALHEVDTSPQPPVIRFRPRNMRSRSH